MTAAYPYRIRLRGGRNTHAAGHRPGYAEPVTACGNVTDSGDTPLDDDAPVTCRACRRALNHG